jgi:hypothetical protein
MRRKQILGVLAMPMLAFSIGPQLAAAADDATAPKPALPTRYKVTVVGATIAATRPDGSPWHVQPPDDLLGAVTTLGLISFGVEPSLAQIAGGAMKGDAKQQPPSPKVRVLIGGEQLETFALPRTSSPSWNYSFAVEAPADRTESVHILVVDAEGDQVIGKKKVSFDTFVAKPGIVVEDVGSAELVQFKVEALPLTAASAAYKFTVDGTADIDALAKEVDRRPRAGVAGDWRGVPVLNGDFVRIRAVGSVCPNSGNICGGPEGVTAQRKPGWQSYDRPAFKGLNHAALVGMLAGKPLYAGRWLEFRAERAGTLLLGVNDTGLSNNSGAFQVDVEINPPDLVTTGTVGSCGYMVDHALVLAGVDDLPAESRDAVAARFPDAVRECEAKQPTAAQRKCVITATNGGDLGGCGL